jgi:hypothetical protein
MSIMPPTPIFAAAARVYGHSNPQPDLTHQFAVIIAVRPQRAFISHTRLMPENRYNVKFPT